MNYRNLNLTIISANGLKKPTFMGKMDVYAVVSISGTIGNPQKLKTNISKHANSDPTWNFPMKFIINEAAGFQNRLTLVIKIKAAGIFGGRNLGEVHVPVKELLEGVKDEGKTMQFVSYQVRRPSGKVKGVLSFSYEVGEKFTGKPEEPVTAYPPGYGYQQQQQPGYGYYPPPPPASSGYGGYPPPPPVVVPPRGGRMGNSGMGFGTGLLGGALGGMLLGEMMSGGGGGCGGGGCGGGGCGGGGCGGGGCGGS
ncbi:putative C2 domain-containing protein [Helianthus annuus]|nr:putative C2 domain-containing protein [Helianthus annuus]KAJ0762606.1 putative C2 domain-containing protein [Helianthus annuus]KAJ0932855.1 putative C2 domain-containing protein [Helianthus annuus]